MSEIAERLEDVRERIARAATRAGRRPDDVTLVAVSKRHPTSAIRAAFAAGARVFGENYVQELRAKQDELADLGALGLAWHFIGRLQRNKAKDVAGRVARLHAVDSVELAEALDRRLADAAPGAEPLGVLVQINASGEVSKGGVAPDALPALLEGLAPLAHVRCVGLMTMPPPAERPDDNRGWFRTVAELARRHGLRELSMGMTDDFEVAIEEGATYVRVGTAIFGERT